MLKLFLLDLFSTHSATGNSRQHFVSDLFNTFYNEGFAREYREACTILTDSPRASAALSRRCLHHLLSEKAHVKSSNLADAIQEVIDSDSLPPYIAESINDVRWINGVTH